MSFTILFCTHNLCNDMTESMKSTNFILLRLHSYIKVTPLTYNGYIFVNLESFSLSTRISKQVFIYYRNSSHIFSFLTHIRINKILLKYEILFKICTRSFVFVQEASISYQPRNLRTIYTRDDASFISKSNIRMIMACRNISVISAYATFGINESSNYAGRKVSSQPAQIYRST